MNTNKKVFISVIIIIIVMVASFFAGRNVTQVENSNTRSERCCTLIGFAIDKAENEDLADQGIMRALISNVYAAYQFCDNSVVANQLHDLWNYLVFVNDDGSESVKEITLIELNDALRAIKTSD